MAHPPDRDDPGTAIRVNGFFQTGVPHIHAVGDVIGFPSLASTSKELGRIAARHAFGAPAESTPDLLPYGIYTIPEISIVGRSGEELTDAGVPYEVGRAACNEISRGQILGEGATEPIHIGQAVLTHGGGIDYFVDIVFNFPTLAECYKTAAFDGINRLD